METLQGIQRRARMATSLQKPNPVRLVMPSKSLPQQTLNEHHQLVPNKLTQEPETTEQEALLGERCKPRRAVHLERPNPLRLATPSKSLSQNINEECSETYDQDVTQGQRCKPRRVIHLEKPRPRKRMKADIPLMNDQIVDEKVPSFQDVQPVAIPSYPPPLPAPTSYIDQISSPANKFHPSHIESQENVSRTKLFSHKSVDSGLGDMSFSPRDSPLFNVSHSQTPQEEEWEEMDASERSTFTFEPHMLKCTSYYVNQSLPFNALKMDSVTQPQSYRPHDRTQQTDISNFHPVEYNRNKVFGSSWDNVVDRRNRFDNTSVCNSFGNHSMNNNHGNHSMNNNNGNHSNNNNHGNHSNNNNHGNHSMNNSNRNHSNNNNNGNHSMNNSQGNYNMNNNQGNHSMNNNQGNQSMTNHGNHSMNNHGNHSMNNNQENQSMNNHGNQSMTNHGNLSMNNNNGNQYMNNNQENHSMNNHYGNHSIGIPKSNSFGNQSTNRQVDNHWPDRHVNFENQYSNGQVDGGSHWTERRVKFDNQSTNRRVVSGNHLTDRRVNFDTQSTSNNSFGNHSLGITIKSSFGNQSTDRQVSFGSNVGDSVMLSRVNNIEDKPTSLSNIVVTVNSSTPAQLNSFSSNANIQRRSVRLPESSPSTHNVFSANRQIDSNTHRTRTSQVDNRAARDGRRPRREGKQGTSNWAQGFIKSVLHGNNKLNNMTSNTPEKKLDQNSERSFKPVMQTREQNRIEPGCRILENSLRQLRIQSQRLDSHVQEELRTSSRGDDNRDTQQTAEDRCTSPLQDVNSVLPFGEKCTNMSSPVYNLVSTPTDWNDPEVTPKAGSRLIEFTTGESPLIPQCRLNNQHLSAINVQNHDNLCANLTSNENTLGTGIHVYDNTSNYMQYRTKEGDCDIRSISTRSTADCDDISSTSTSERQEEGGAWDFLDELVSEVKHLSFRERSQSDSAVESTPLAQTDQSLLYPEDIDDIEAELDFFDEETANIMPMTIPVKDMIVSVSRQPISPSTKPEEIRKLEEKMAGGYSSSKMRRKMFRLQGKSSQDSSDKNDPWCDNSMLAQSSTASLQQRPRKIKYTPDELLMMGTTDLSHLVPDNWLTLVELYPEVCLYNVAHFFDTTLYAEQRKYVMENWICCDLQNGRWKPAHDRSRVPWSHTSVGPVGDNDTSNKVVPKVSSVWPRTQPGAGKGSVPGSWGSWGATSSLKPSWGSSTSHSVTWPCHQQPRQEQTFTGHVSDGVDLDSKCDVSIRRNMSGAHVVDRTKCPW